MQVNNNTPFPCIAWDNTDPAKDWYVTCLTRVKYRLIPNSVSSKPWELRLAKDQDELFGGDIYYGEDIMRAVRYESDFIPFKPTTDIVLNAAAHTSLASNDWSCGIQVLSPAGLLLKESLLRVCGERIWTSTPLGWAKTPMQETKKVMLRYENSEGGCILGETEDDVPKILAIDSDNPVGSGIKHRKMDKSDYPVAQVNWRKPKMAFKPYPPGFGFINRTWDIRLAYAGTYDRQWEQEQNPYLPSDFSYYHYQSANPELILDSYIELNSQFKLQNLLPAHPQVNFALPELSCFVDTTDHEGYKQRRRMNIDTVLIDIESDDPDDWAVYLSYRHYQRQCSQSQQDNPMQAISFNYLPSELLRNKANQQTKDSNYGG